MKTHCSSCGRENPGTDEGYTGCCNKRLCSGPQYGTDRFGIKTNFVTACCWGEAHKMFAAQGQEAPEGSSKLSGFGAR